MAKAEKTTITKTVTKVTEQPGITLTLSMPEARTIIAIAAKIGGHPDSSPRGWLNNIATVLQEAGVERFTNLEEYRVLSGGMSFSEYNAVSERPVNVDGKVEQWGAR
jgi:hypothetical protein